MASVSTTLPGSHSTPLYPITPTYLTHPQTSSVTSLTSQVKLLATTLLFFMFIHLYLNLHPQPMTQVTLFLNILVCMCALHCVWLFATPWTEAKAILHGKCFPSLYSLSGDFLRLLIPSQMKVIQNLSHYIPSCILHSAWIQFRNLHSLFLALSLFRVERTYSPFLEQFKDNLLHQPAPHKLKVTRSEVQEIFIVIQSCHHPLGTR